MQKSCSTLFVLLLFCKFGRGAQLDLLSGLLNTLGNIGDVLSGLDSSGVYPEAVMGTVEIARYYGYPVEIHHVVTDDGYFLEIHRISRRRYNSTGINKRVPILLQHGILFSSAAWIINGVKDSLGFILADDSYDVWLGNLRGNPLDDHALLDLPAVIDYILKATGKSQLTYMGHSLGSTILNLLLSGKPEYNKKINLAIHLAPVMYLKHGKNPLRLIASNLPQTTKWYRDLTGTNQVTPIGDLQRKFFNIICSSYPGNMACEILVKSLGGYNDELFDRKRGHVFVSHAAAGTSWNVVIHFTQIFTAGKPRHFDFGHYVNWIKYGQSQPPSYEMSKITAKTVLFHGYMDLFNDPKDVQTLADQLPNLVLKEQVPFDTFAHQDFIMCIDARKHLYDRVIQVLKEFE